MLVVDDDRDTVLTLMSLLRDEGYDVKGMYSGKDAVRSLQSFDPDAVPTHRGGIAESITGRMQRNAGVAVIRSHPGHGTEVELAMKRVHG